MIVVSQDMKFDEDGSHSKSQEPPIDIVKGETFVVPKSNPKLKEKFKIKLAGFQSKNKGFITLKFN